MADQKYDLALFAGLLADESHVTRAELARCVNDNSLEGIFEKYWPQLPHRVCRANEKQALQIDSVANPAGSKNTESMVVIDPDTQGNVVLQQLQRNQASI